MFMLHAAQFDFARPANSLMLSRAPALPGSGIAGQTKVETESGWVQVSDLVPGMGLATLDGGFAALRGLRRVPASSARCVVVPGGALGNCEELILAPGQGVLLPTGPAEVVLDAALALVRASALVGHFGIRQGDPSTEPMMILEFAEAEAVWANTGVLLNMGGEMGTFCSLNSTQARALLEILATADNRPWPVGLQSR